MFLKLIGSGDKRSMYLVFPRTISLRGGATYCKLFGQFHGHRVIMAPKTFLARSLYTDTKCMGIVSGCVTTTIHT